MDITERKVEDLLMNTVFTDSAHKDAVRDRLKSEKFELTADDLEGIAGGAGYTEFHLINDSFFRG